MGLIYWFSFGVLIVLMLPVRFSLAVQRAEGWGIDIKAVYGWGLVSYNRAKAKRRDEISIRVLNLITRNLRTDYTDSVGAITIKHKRRDLPSVLRRAKKMLPYLLDMVWDVLNSVTGKQAALRLKLGFNDPAYTGIVTGLIACITGNTGKNMQYVPDFSEEIFEMDFRLKGVVIPLVLFFIMVKHCTFYLREQVLIRINVKGGKKIGYYGQS